MNQAGVFGIGENEPGFNFIFKDYYILISRSGSANITHKAHFDNISILIIRAIFAQNLNADFTFIARTDDSLNTVEVANGAIQIDY